ncbi:hypothetical protein HUK65_13685 [Rhodobacteraceae bacterium 2376]|uniref:Uncharacterized protein n=1 Tax=Rhabdonatronobacter sediminivivens TaxID=2743469 RepID=A0A7Z0I166_9RHOB|nr:hypothetical protein [Rhabdonatronobacter sediminivivens]NYS26033.1 hypothetical protein [Rhabdonatronobacter sediminivivens]NYS26041.1 hypothetical protein [Rhabdonatronobacter sediminivivens]
MAFFSDTPAGPNTRRAHDPQRRYGTVARGGGDTRSAPRANAVVVFTDDMARDMFARTTVLLEDGVLPVKGKQIGWKRTNRGLLGAIYVNPNTGARFLFAPDLRKQCAEPTCIARLA